MKSSNASSPGELRTRVFLDFFFPLSESYASRVLLHLIKDGVIILYGGFQYDQKRILHLLSLIEGPSTSPPSVPFHKLSSTPPRDSSGSASRSTTKFILKPSLWKLNSTNPSYSNVIHSTPLSSSAATSNSHGSSSRSIPARKLW